MSTGGSSILLVLVALLSLGALLPPLCSADYHLWIQTDDDSISNTPEFNPSLLASPIVPSINATNSRTDDIALQAQQDNQYPLQPVSNMLPQRLFLIYGLESSGTTFTARTIATALGIPKQRKGDFVESDDGSVHVQHISLPWGGIKRGEWGFRTQYSEPLPMIPVFYPKPCQMDPPTHARDKPPSLQPPPDVCREFMEEQVMTRPHRFFVNMTTHITWYRERGVLVYPIIVVRDPLLHFKGVTDRRLGHTPNDQAAYAQYEMGRAIIVETINKGLNPIIISYETMLTLQKPYLRQLYHTLGIESDFIPTFKNGNTKYLSQGSGFEFVEVQLMKEDGSQPRDVPPGIRAKRGRPGPLGATVRAGDIDFRSRIQATAQTRVISSEQQSGKHRPPNLRKDGFGSLSRRQAASLQRGGAPLAPRTAVDTVSQSTLTGQRISRL
jgi:hypothetical protein